MAYAYIKVAWDDNNLCKNIELLDINKSFENVFDINRNYFIGKDLKDYLGIDNNYKLSNILKNTINNKTITTLNLPNINIHLNIEIYNFEKDEYHIRFTKVTNDIGTISDILKNSPFIAWIKDRNGKYIDANYKYFELLNISREDIIGKYDSDIWNEDNADTFTEQDKNILKEDKLRVYEETLTLKNNEVRYFQTAKWPYKDITGKTILGTTGIAVEITDKVKLRESIKKNEQNFLDIVNNIDELIIIRDEKRATYVSPYFEKLYGFKPDSLYDDINSWYEYWDEIEFENTPQNYEHSEINNNVFRVVKYGKIDKWIYSKFVPIFDENGNVVKKIGILKDITDKKNIEEELDNLRFEFFANLSHELRTPINLIMSVLQVVYPMLDKTSDKDSTYLVKYFNILSQNSFRLLKLVNNLIDITKIDSGNFAYNPKNENIVYFVENICDSVVEFVEHNNMNIVFDTDVEEKIIAFDLDHIERIILNLLSNAIKFNKENGVISVSISTDDDIKISIKDEGIGIPEDKIDSIFERFEQVNKNMKREREGSGIGLSLVKSLVDINNGSISLTSEINKGSEFTITLPNILVDSDNSSLDMPFSDRISRIDVEFSDIYL